MGRFKKLQESYPIGSPEPSIDPSIGMGIPPRSGDELPPQRVESYVEPERERDIKQYVIDRLARERAENAAFPNQPMTEANQELMPLPAAPAPDIKNKKLQDLLNTFRRN